MTRTAKFTLFSPIGLVFMLTLGAVSCTTTPTTNTPESGTVTSASPGSTDISDPAMQATVYEVDGAENIEVTDLPTPPEQNQVVLKPTAPTEYIVQKGDTLWDISRNFLNEPWFWPEIWYSNPQIRNPHLIYPGDVITVFYVGGKPYLTVGDGPRISGLQKLSPSVRSEPIEQEILEIPIQTIQQLLIKPRIVSKEELDVAPYIVGSRDNRLIYGAGDRVYIRGLEEPVVGTSYSVFRAGNEYLDPDTGELLGFEVIQVGDGELIDDRQPASFDLINSEREALRGDRLLPVEISDHTTAFFPRAPTDELHGKIISLYDAISQVGTYQVVTINRGERDGIQRGYVVSILQSGRTINDPFAENVKDNIVQLPDEVAGTAMIFRTFEKVSYALIMNAQVPVRVGDSITNPH